MKNNYIKLGISLLIASTILPSSAMIIILLVLAALFLIKTFSKEFRKLSKKDLLGIYRRWMDDERTAFFIFIILFCGLIVPVLFTVVISSKKMCNKHHHSVQNK